MSPPNTTATLENGLPQINRYITDHNASGKAVVSKALSEEAQWSSVGVANFFLGYTTRTFPVSLATSGPEGSVPDDVKSYTNDMQVPMGLSVPNGTVLRFVDMAPNALSPMHRTVSLDYGVIIEGTVELVLDSGEIRVLNRGDVCVQRATAHAWRNVTPGDKWARMMFVLVTSEEPEVNGKKLGEELADMPESVKRNA